MSVLFHIATRRDWESAVSAGTYDGVAARR